MSGAIVTDPVPETEIDRSARAAGNTPQPLKTTTDNNAANTRLLRNILISP
jgi:hypothetical protein